MSRYAEAMNVSEQNNPEQTNSAPNTSNTLYDCLVIGAGVAGLRAARSLQAAGQHVAVLDKSRGVGGRAATRRYSYQDHVHPIDHGTQYFTVRDERFAEQVTQWQEQGEVRVWAHGFAHYSAAQGWQNPGAGHPRYIFPEGMNRIGKLLAEGLRVYTQQQVQALWHDAARGCYVAESAQGQRFYGRRVLLNMPPAQLLALCADRPYGAGLAETLQGVRMAPCFALMAGYSGYEPAWQGVVLEHPILAWLANDSSKRPQESTQRVIVMHAQAEFSEMWLERPPETVSSTMLEAAASIDPVLGEPDWQQLQRWRYALASQPYPERYLQLSEAIYACGDWCGGSKLEDAYLSGLAVAEAIMGN